MYCKFEYPSGFSISGAKINKEVGKSIASWILNLSLKKNKMRRLVSMWAFN
jgi:hypothetical protein